MGTPRAQEIRRSVQDDLNESSGVYAIGKSPPFGHKKNPRQGWQRAHMKFLEMSVSIYLIINPLDNAVICHAVIPVIEHRDDDVLMHLNAN